MDFLPFPFGPRLSILRQLTDQCAKRMPGWMDCRFDAPVLFLFLMPSVSSTYSEHDSSECDTAIQALCLHILSSLV